MRVVYKITNKVTGEFYIGSTMQWKTRKSQHRNMNDKYCRSKKLYEDDAYKKGEIKYDILDTYKDGEITREDLRKKEGEYYFKFKGNPLMLNNYSPYGLDLARHKEWYQKNKEKQKEYDKEWYQKNKEYQREKIKCDVCGSIMSRDSISRHKKSKKCNLKI